MTLMTGLRAPKRVVWVLPDGKPYRVDSVSFNTDVSEYVKEMRRREGHNYDYYILED